MTGTLKRSKPVDAVIAPDYPIEAVIGKNQTKSVNIDRHKNFEAEL